MDNMDHLKAPDRLAYAVAPRAGLLATDGPGLKKKDERHLGPLRLAWSPSMHVDVGAAPSDHVLTPVFNIGTVPAKVRVTSLHPNVVIESAPGRLAPSGTLHGDALTAALRALKVRVSPTSPDEIKARIRIRATWEDGYEDITQEVTFRVHGYPMPTPAKPAPSVGAAYTGWLQSRAVPTMAPSVAASLVAAQAPAAGALAPGDATELSRAGSASDTPMPGTLSRELDHWKATIQLASTRQQAGVSAVEAAQLGYKRRVAHTTISWGDLAAFAVSTATAGIAGGISKIVSTALKDAGEALATGVGDALKDGLKIGIKAAIAADPRTSSAGPADASLASFFLTQRELVANTVFSVSERFIDASAGYQDAFAVDPKGTLATLQAARHSFADTQATAAAMQQTATANALASYLARARYGEETVEGMNAGKKVSMQATPLADAAPRHSRGITGQEPGGSDGVLDVFVTAGSVTIDQARLKGMGSANVGALAGQPLGSLTLPMRVVIGRYDVHQARITRDEAGRLIFDGEELVLRNATRDLPAGATTTERMVAIVDRVRSQLLPPRIETDDAN